MNNTYAQIIENVNALNKSVNTLTESLKGVDLSGTKEWFTTAEFAALKGLKSKTVSNYASKGRYNHTKRLPNGQHLIHRSELK